MSQSPFHVALIMDCNGRWAQLRSLPRLAGHVQGERALRRIVSAAPHLGIDILTVYAFSSDNWNRPPAEVGGLMRLLETHLLSAARKCKAQGTRISVIGRRDRIPATARRIVERAERETASGTRLHLRIAVDYSSRDALLRAFQCASGTANRAGIESSLDSPDVDFLIRTGGEQRLSDFLLWECAYAELFFTSCLWPDFGPCELENA